MIDHYILDADHRPVKAELLEWAAWFEDPDNRRIAIDQTGLFEISTVFIGLDHQWGQGPPLLFETMIFEREHGGDTNYGEEYECWRYATWDDAMTGHQAALRRLQKQEADALAVSTHRP